MSNFEKPKQGNPFWKEIAKKEPGLDEETKVLQELQRRVKSAPKSLAAEIRLPVSFPGIKGELVGRLAGTPLVRKWDCFSCSHGFKAETPISSGLSCGSLNRMEIINWKEAVHDLGKPISVTTTLNSATVVWEKGTDHLRASLSPERLIEADIPFETTNIHAQKEYSGESLYVVGDLDFKDIGKFIAVKLGHGEQSEGYYIAPASLTKVGAGLPESHRKEIIAELRSTRKELPAYNAERKFELALKATNEFPLKDLPGQISIVGLAESVTVQTDRWSSNEEVRGNYGDESWGTGSFMEVDHEQRYLLCDGVRVNLPESNGSLGGAFFRTGDAVARAYLEWGSSYMEWSLEKLKVELERVNLKYPGVPDPAIYGDFDEQASNPAEDAARKNLEKLLNELNTRVEDARLAAMLGLERTDPAKAEEKLVFLPGYAKRYEEAKKIMKDEGLDRFSDKGESEDTARKLLKQASKDAKAKNFLAVSSALQDIQQAVERFEQTIIQARTAREAYLERKATLRSKAEELKNAVSGLQSHERFQRLSGDLLSRVRQVIRTDLTPSKWKADDYNTWNAKIEALLIEARAALEALPIKIQAQKSFPVQEPMLDERNQKAEFKQERERTQAEKFGAALAERALAVMGRNKAIDIIQDELDASYGRARRQAKLKSCIGGEKENHDLDLLYNLSKAAVFDEAMMQAINILTSEPASLVAPVIRKKEQKKPPETLMRSADVSIFDTNKLFGGRGNKTKNK
ncbi:MAG: hypothetical protein ABIB04_05125 [Patescibacteria group bacterium]